MILTVSAAQGQGKTTFINDVMKFSRFKEHFSQYPTKSARTVITEFGGDLQAIYADKTMMCDFQSRILAIHSAILDYRYYTKFLLVERSFIDIMAFTVMNLGRFNDLNEWMDTFSNVCIQKQSRVHRVVYIPKFLNSENDGVRPYNDYYNNAYDAYLKSLVGKFPSITINESNAVARISCFDASIADFYGELL